jgi:hypothetical protein
LTAGSVDCRPINIKASHRLIHLLHKMEKNPWYKNVNGPFLQWQGPVGVKSDGGGCTRGRGRVGKMVIHRATCNKDKEGDYMQY